MPETCGRYRFLQPEATPSTSNYSSITHLIVPALNRRHFSIYLRQSPFNSLYNTLALLPQRQKDPVPSPVWHDTLRLLVTWQRCLVRDKTVVFPGGGFPFPERCVVIVVSQPVKGPGGKKPQMMLRWSVFPGTVGITASPPFYLRSCASSIFLCIFRSRRASGPLYLRFYSFIHEDTGNWIMLSLCACVGVSFCMVLLVLGGGGGYL